MLRSSSTTRIVFMKGRIRPAIAGPCAVCKRRVKRVVRGGPATAFRRPGFPPRPVAEHGAGRHAATGPDRRKALLGGQTGYDLPDPSPPVPGATQPGGSMHLAGETEIAATRLRVWETISNPNRAAESNSAGQAQIEKIDDRHYRVSVSPPAA